MYATFFESYSETAFVSLALTGRFVQDNQSCSKQGVLRGLHFQVEQPPGKLVRILTGDVFDVAVDLRCESATFRSGRLVPERSYLRRPLAHCITSFRGDGKGVVPTEIRRAVSQFISASAEDQSF
jgi:hypothetical protein